MFEKIYKGLNVLVTGHTGFKGSWLTVWLNKLGANVIGYSAYLPSVPCNFEVTSLEKKITHIEGDVRDYRYLEKVIKETKPEIIFHLAAQPIVRKSYEDPKLTLDTNIGGTVNILECIRTSDSVNAGVIITSDKCYRNVEWVWGYRENDPLGGDDPYSASKGAAELVINSYAKCFFSETGTVRIASARAGNVIGGGDWAADRIVPDCVRAFSTGKQLEIRNPYATRPWQHVLEPLSGYLLLGANLLKYNPNSTSGAFNFGPLSDVNRTVGDLIKEFSISWGSGKWCVLSDVGEEKKESTLLKLNCDKAQSVLNWTAALKFDKTIKMTADWYKAYFGRDKNMYDFSLKQIEEYTTLASKRGINWARGDDND